MKIKASSVAINGRAYMITGESGAGKSSLALALINRGGQLISDDVTEVRDNIAYAPRTHQGWIEVRGIGLVSGLPVCSSAKIGAFIRLCENKPERLPEADMSKIPEFWLWTQDKNQADKVLVIDSVLAGRLKLESGKEL
ncbi:MAG: hypothetical protein IKS41_06410 [Alphaproteobacteria bacterium]|nr:hypothetical protein [Alphaproteobacteria bacterium]